MERAGNDDSAERTRPRRVSLERLDELFGPPVEVFAATPDDGRDGHADSPQRGPPSVGTVVLEDVLRFARPVEAQVAPGASNAERARHEIVPIACGDALRHGHAAAQLRPADLLH